MQLELQREVARRQEVAERLDASSSTLASMRRDVEARAGLAAELAQANTRLAATEEELHAAKQQIREVGARQQQ